MTPFLLSILKTTKVIRVFKKDSKLDDKNYRPISLLSNIKKMLEKRMHKKWYIFVNNSDAIYNLEFGLKKQYSSSHALINVTENTRKVLDDGNVGYGVFVGSQKAFDTVDHQILLEILSDYGICGV